MTPEAFQLAIAHLVEGSLRLPHGFFPGACPDGQRAFPAQLDWDFYQWNPPEYLVGVEGFEDYGQPDPDASPKPTWDAIRSAYEAARLGPLRAELIRPGERAGQAAHRHRLCGRGRPAGGAHPAPQRSRHGGAECRAVTTHRRVPCAGGAHRRGRDGRGAGGDRRDHRRRVDGTEDEFLLNPFGLFFEEITASSLIRVDRRGNVTDGSEHGVNKAGFIIHGAIHVSHPNHET